MTIAEGRANGTAFQDERHHHVLFLQVALVINVFLLLIRVATYEKDIIVEYGSSFILAERKDLLINAEKKEPQLPPLPWLSPLSEQMEDGCRTWQGPQKVQESEPTPTGVVVSLLLDKEHVDNVCSFFPAQLEYFLQPQGLDVLFIVSPSEHSKNKAEMNQLMDCLNLSHRNPKSYRIWKNADGSKLKTWEYTFGFMMSGLHSTNTNSYTDVARYTSVFLGETKLEFPQYVRDNMSILDLKVENPRCQAPHPTYIQESRWYTRELLHLSILKEYEYFIKMDSDIAFIRPIPFAMLHDMKLRGAVFAHTAKFTDRFKIPCGEDITKCIKDFRHHYQTHKDIFLQHSDSEALSLVSSHDDTLNTDWIAQSEWGGGICSSTLDVMYNDRDRYYTNFIIGRTDYFQSSEVLALGEFLSEWPDGFFRHHWTDQVFWHFALGLFIGPHYESEAVADYTEFRCAPAANCWLSMYDETRYPGTMSRCANGGSFVHTRDQRENYAKPWSQANFTAALQPTKRQDAAYETKYRNRCPTSYGVQ